jgi:hypothetical protein
LSWAGQPIWHAEAMNGEPAGLDGKLIMLIEEERFLAGYLGQALSAAGGQVLGPARCGAEAAGLVANLRTTPDAAVVSMEVLDQAGPTLSDALARLDLPVLLICKQPRGRATVPPTAQLMTAPFAAYQVVESVSAMLAPPAA